MAKTEIGASVNVEFQSVGQMRKAIKEATSDLIIMQEQFGKSSPQAIEAARRIAEMKDRIQDAKEQADLFDPGNKFKAFTVAAQQLAGGFAAVQGAMALVGSESEDLQKGMAKVQGALALSQGLSQLGDLEKSFEALNTFVKTNTFLQKANAAATSLTSSAMRALGITVNTTSTSFKVLKTAIVSTGIGALVVAIGFAVEALMNLADSSDEATKAEKALEKQQKQSEETLKLRNKALQESIEGIDQLAQTAVKRAKLEGKSESDIVEIQRKALQDKIKLREKDLSNLDTSSEEFFAKKKEYGKAISDLENFELDEQLKRQEKAQAKREAKQKKTDDEALKAKEEADKILMEASLAAMSERQREEATILKKFEDNKKALQKAGIKDFTAIEEQKENELKAVRDKYQKITEDNLAANAKRTADLRNQLRLAQITDEKERDKLDTELKMQAELDSETQRYKAGEVRLEQYLINLALIRQRYAEEGKAKDEENAKLETERLAAAHENTRKMVAEQNAALLQAEIELQNQRFNAASAGLDSLASLAGQNEKIANIIFAVQKGLEIARIVADTARGVVAAKAGLAAVPAFIGVVPNPAFVLAAANAAKQITGLKIAAAVGIAQIAAASIQKFKGGGGGGSQPSGGGGGGNLTPPPPGNLTPPVALTPSPTVTATAVNTQAVNALGNQAPRAYVLNSDLQNNDQRNAYLQRNARLG